MICNSYLGQPIKKHTCKWIHMCYLWLNIHGICLRLGHYYELKYPCNLIYMYVSFNGNNAYDKWAHRVTLTLLASTLNPLHMTPSGVVWASWTVKGLRYLLGCFEGQWHHVHKRSTLLYKFCYSLFPKSWIRSKLLGDKTWCWIHIGCLCGIHWWSASLVFVILKHTLHSWGDIKRHVTFWICDKS